MGYAQILDCTLRDGGYLIDKYFGNKNIYGIIDGLIKTGIEIIEIGFLQNEGTGEGKTVYQNSIDAEKFIPKTGKNGIFSVFADYSRYDIAKLDKYTGKSFHAVRECFLKKEWKEAINYCREIKEKGYLLFVQPVDILGYSDLELIELLESVNAVEPYCFSIVDTFGSMYEEDLYRICSLVDHNLVPGCKIGFHSHNNLQMSSALAQAFLRFAYGKREVIVDATISGMGRGAGNTPTELIAQYMVDKLKYPYNLDCLLDIIDNYMRNIRSRAEWGYNTQMYLAGAYGAHVNNVSYLLKKNSINSKDIRFILNQIGTEKRKRYDYSLLEDTYIQYMETDIDDTKSMSDLRRLINGRCVVVLAAGRSLSAERENIIKYIESKESLVISVNNMYDNIPADFIYISNVKRYQSWNKKCHEGIPCIFTSNIKKEAEENEFIISFKRLIKCGWENMDNSAILLLRLLNMLGAECIGVAGLDGYDYNNNYADDQMEYNVTLNEAIVINRELREMLQDFMAAKSRDVKVEFITKSRFEDIMQ